MDVVLSGATGFVGSAVLRLTGRYRIHALVRGAHRLRHLPPSASVRIVEGDVRTLPGQLFPRQPHIVIHLATKQVDSDGTGFEETNVEGTRRLVEGCNQATRGILYGSSVSVYGQDQQIDLEESAPLRPETALARTRARAEQLVLDAAAGLGIAAYCLRPRFIVGQGDRHTFPGLVRMVRRGIQPGGGRQRYSIIDVDDYARVLLALAGRIESGQANERIALNVAYSQSPSLNEIVSVICTEFGLARPWMRIPVHRWMIGGLRRLPGVAAGSLATRLELFAFSHTLRVDRLRARIGGAIPGSDPVAALRRVASLQQSASRRAVEKAGRH
jgi:nucleoside-diphosphate-sugar epimerase